MNPTDIKVNPADRPGRPRPATPKGRRRRQLMDATVRCISEYGLSGTTLARVAKTAGLSTGIVNFYFTGKKQLLLETLRDLSREYRAAMVSAFEFSDQPAEILRDVIRTHFAPQLCTPEKIAVWYAFSGESRARREYLSVCRDQDDWFRESLLKVVADLCRRDGAQKPGANFGTNSGAHGNTGAVAIARGLEGLLDGYWQDFLYAPTKFNPQTAIATCEEYLAAFFGGPKAKPSASATPSFEHRIGDLLAPWTYRNDELLALEIQHLFKENWLLAGHISDLPEPGDYLTLDVFGEGALVVRGEDHRVRAFHNICRHRGAKLVEGDHGRCPRALTCPFHGWTYRLDGRLVGVPAEATFANLDKAENGLVPLAVEIWMGFVFVRFAGAGPSLADTMKPIAHRVARYRMHEMKPLPGTRFTERRPCNWKVIHDIDNEGYHVPVGHPGLRQLYGDDYRDASIGGVSVSLGHLNQKPGKSWSVRHYQKLLPSFDHLSPEQRRLWFYIGIFPNMVLALYPEQMEFYMTIPLGTESTRLRGGSYALPDFDGADRLSRAARATRYLGARINRVANREDDAFVRRLQRGLRSSAFPEPRLSSIEHGVREFHRQIQAILPVARLVNAPPAGGLARVNAELRAEMGAEPGQA